MVWYFMTDVISILSEDVKSFVAAYLLAKKGIICRLIYFDITPDVDQKTHDLVIKNYQQLFKKVPECVKSFHIVPFARSLDEVKDACSDRLVPIITRRLQYRIENALYKKLGGSAIVVGDVLVQSDTISRFIIEDGASSFPIFRPLIGLDSTMIEDLIEELGLFLIVDPKSKVLDKISDISLDEIKQEEKKINIANLVNYSVEGLKHIE